MKRLVAPLVSALLIAARHRCLRQGHAIRLLAVVGAEDLVWLMLDGGWIAEIHIGKAIWGHDLTINRPGAPNVLAQAGTYAKGAFLRP